MAEGATPAIAPREAQITALLGGNALFESFLAPDDTVDLRGAYWVGAEDLPIEAFAPGPEDLAAIRDDSGYLPAGLGRLREAIALHLTGTGLPTSADEVLVTTGAQQGLSLITQLVVRPGERVVVEDPTFPGALSVFATMGAALVPVPVGPRGVEPAVLDGVVGRVAPRMVYLVPTVHNPTGTTMPRAARRALVAAAADWGAVVVDDCTLVSTWLDAPPPEPLAALRPSEREGPPILTIGSLSKGMWGGLRVGWVRGPEDTIARLARLKASVDLGAPLPSQFIAARLLPRAEQIRAARQPEQRRRLEILAQGIERRLPEWRFARPSGGLSLWVELPEGSGHDFASVAARHGVGVTPGAACSAVRGFSGHLRLTFGNRPELLTLGVERLAEAWDDYLALMRRETVRAIV